MQDKETVDDAEEALTCKVDTNSSPTTPAKKEADVGKKDSTKDGKFAFKKMKQPKKEKADKNKPDKKKYEGEGVSFKAKLIGAESVSDARGDQMCQDAMLRLKMNVKNIGPHKRKITISVSMQGIKIKDDKTGAVMYHHPVNYISFISQDIMDARAFGYVFGSTSEPHQFIAIKTEKPAFHVVLAIRDLFQTVLFHKKEAIGGAKSDLPKNETPAISQEKKSEETKVPIEEQIPKNDNIYVEVLLTEPIAVPEESPKTEQPANTVDDLIGLQDELNKLQQGIDQMDTSIAAAAALNSEVPVLEKDPFDTSFVLGPKRDSFAIPMPTPIPIAAPVQADDNRFSDLIENGDKYAVFNVLDSSPSIFEVTTQETNDQAAAEMKQLEEEIARKAAPPKPPRTSKTETVDLTVFADLDPLGKDRPYKDKTEFFQDVKNPPKKVLNDLFDPNKEASRVLDVNMLISSVPFPVDFENPTHPNVPIISSSLPNAFPSNLKLSLANGNGEVISNNLLKTRKTSEPNNPAFFNVQPYARVSSNPQGIHLSPHQQLNGNAITSNMSPTSQIISTSSSPIPIPSRNGNIEKDASFSSGSIGSPYSKSPQQFSSDSPGHSDYFNHNYSTCEGSSPNGYKLQQIPFVNGENGNGFLSNGHYKHSSNGYSNSTVNTSNQNGVSRPRPRPSLNKCGSVQNGGRTVSSHSLSSDSSSDYEMISRENMQSITNVLITNGHRLRAQSLKMDSSNDFKLQRPSEKTIFSKKNDPFSDDFFFSLPKKNNHLTQAEMPEYV